MSHLLVTDVITKTVHENIISFVVKSINSHKNHEWFYYFLKLHSIIRGVQIFKFFVTKKLTKKNLINHENEKRFKETEQVRRLTYVKFTWTRQIFENNLSKMQWADDDIDIKKNEDVVTYFKTLQKNCIISNIDHATEERRNHFDTSYRSNADRQNLHKYKCQRYI